ncbi:MAG: enoyl-CoA hydratase, partial [Gammaproteobacteria bacterium]|nr:enoyl-CoA hydratase [Gammaproteobacteria bacterium]NIR98455.1 enoyl-CoA hydratase [Gammaproteobacteria bacterium]NIT64200.1 enoyl-CoA hydratase [Gammaproteobacteria bacterium]NIV21143.1 enoyl-CoA hydratase [Gammaproteobacteria bacterium]NIY32780.1 enoyl-CoA hydratase [Gammaproteobacteria bacterium]
MSEPVLVERQGPLAIVTLNRPEALNALDTSLRRGLGAALGALHGDDAVRGIVITAAGDR